MLPEVGIDDETIKWPRLRSKYSGCRYNTDKMLSLYGSRRCNPDITAQFDAGDGKNATITINKKNDNFQIKGEILITPDPTNLDDYVYKTEYDGGREEVPISIDLQEYDSKTKLFVIIKIYGNDNGNYYDCGFFLGPLILNAKGSSTTYNYKVSGLSGNFFPDAPSGIDEVVETRWEGGEEEITWVNGKETFHVESSAICDLKVEYSANGSMITLTGRKKGGFLYPGKAYVYEAKDATDVTKLWFGNILAGAKYSAGQEEFTLTFDASFLSGNNNKLCVVVRADAKKGAERVYGYRTNFITINVN